MIAKILAWPVILIGILWTLKPQILRNAMTRKTGWQVFLLAAWFFLMPLLHLGYRSMGFLGMLLVLIPFAMAVSRIYALIGTAFAKVPIVYFVAIGVANIIGGMLMLRG